MKLLKLDNLQHKKLQSRSAHLPSNSGNVLNALLNITKETPYVGSQVAACCSSGRKVCQLGGSINVYIIYIYLTCILLAPPSASEHLCKPLLSKAKERRAKCPGESQLLILWNPRRTPLSWYSPVDKSSNIILRSVVTVNGAAINQMQDSQQLALSNSSPTLWGCCKANVQSRSNKDNESLAATISRRRTYSTVTEAWS